MRQWRDGFWLLVEVVWQCPLTPGLSPGGRGEQRLERK
jgi:hypothetical protein